MAYIGPDGEFLPEVGDGAEIYNDTHRRRLYSAYHPGPAEGWDRLIKEQEKKIDPPKKTEKKKK